ncbi:MAG TPA: cytochrome b/b6 domain-containing protein [Candidatus Binatia bacterium]|nr:cytochrome b/b6 domain-containing protein [Candidatus Binatia bacterium]
MKRCGVLLIAALLPLMAAAPQTAQAGTKKGASAGASSSAAPAKMSNGDCLACHSDPSLTKEENGKQVSLHVDEAKFKSSIHSAFGCTDCHTDIKAVPHDPTPAKPRCATCHADQQTAYDHGVHAKAAAAGNTNVARCQDCHGNVHELLPAADPASKVARGNIPQTCGACHGQKFVMASGGISSAPFTSYQESVHGKAVAAGSGKAAVCTDCHGEHDILGAIDPKSPINKFNVPATCAKCHDNIRQEYARSIHGQAIARGNWQSPVCTDCHGIHTIKAPKNPSSSVAAANVKNTCGQCHGGVRLSREFGVPGERVSSYLASYHGLAQEVGSNTVANCASCHGAHNILPSSDPRSTINHANLAKTCGQCHPGASTKFISSKVHLDGTSKADVGSKVIGLIQRFYIWMIVCVVGGMVLHNLIVWRRKLILHRIGQPRILFRMTLAQRIQHLTLLISFFTLVVTGFALRYPSSWLAAIFIKELVRSYIHRVAGVVLISVSLFHLWYIITRPDGRRLFRDMLPDWKDATDARDAMRYYLGYGDRRPMFGRFTYAEKMEYWALVWGMFVMAGTGLMAWFKVAVARHVPGWWIDAAITIHFYEAVLATLAIVVWHLYGVMFDPDTYPMNWAWFDGKMSIEQYQHEHPLDQLAIEKAQGSEEPEAASEAVAPEHAEAGAGRK